MARTLVSILDCFAADSPVTTEFRRLLHSIKSLDDSKDLKTILVTSAILSEGKSTVCAFLAVTAARRGLKTLVIDCDLHRPTIHKLFAVPRGQGTVELLSEGLAIKNATQKTDLAKLDIITAGRASLHPTDLFDARAVGPILADLKFYYDLVLIDSPPVIPVSDPMLLAGEVDGVLLVVKAGSTQREVAARATEILRSSSNNLLGVVMNDVNHSLPYYYDYRHYRYQYGSTLPDRGSSSGKDKDSSGGSPGDIKSLSDQHRRPDKGRSISH